MPYYNTIEDAIRKPSTFKFLPVLSVVDHTSYLERVLWFFTVVLSLQMYRN